MSLTDYGKQCNVWSLEIYKRFAKLNGNICTLLTGLQSKTGLTCYWVIEWRADFNAGITAVFSGKSQEAKIASDDFHKGRIIPEKTSYNESNKNTLS